METRAGLTYGRIFRLWLPLAATWLMMSIEGPFLAAVIARLPDPIFNLAAYGVAFSFATIAEAPIIMILSASTTLVKDLQSYRQLRNFSLALNLGVTIVILLGLLPPIFGWIAKDLIGLPDSVAELTHRALLLLVPWPAAIGYRRFYQGILIRQNLTRRVAMGTMIRVMGMSVGAIVLFSYFELPGALVGAGALSIGVVLEAIGTQFMAWGVRARIEKVSAGAPRETQEMLSLRQIADFYFPLALTSVIALGVQPTMIFFLGGSRRALDSLAVLPVISSLTFLFRSIGLSYQEAAIALLDGTRENFRRVSTFAVVVGLAATVGLCLIAFTPLVHVWFRSVSGLSPELSDFAVLPLQIFASIPFFSMQLAYQRAILVSGRATRSVTLSTMIEVATIVSVLYFTIHVLNWVGVVAAVVSLLAGRIVGNAYMMYACHLVLSSTGVFRRAAAAAPAIAPASHPDVS
jgi:progressive ankylosis protein